MRRESKDGIHGRIRAQEVVSHIGFLVVREQKRKYILAFLRQLKKYSFRKHREREERHEGCRYWLEGVSKIDFRKPEEYALVIMGDMDRKPQKEHARRFYNSFAEYLKSFS